MTDLKKRIQIPLKETGHSKVLIPTGGSQGGPLVPAERQAGPGSSYGGQYVPAPGLSFKLV